MFHVSVMAPENQTIAEKFIQEIEYWRTSEFLKSVSKKYLLYKGLVESKTANVKISNFELSFSVENAMIAAIIANNFKGTMSCG